MKDNITILEMKGITKRFSGVTALDNCELTLSKGEVHCLVGENGAGKSTLVKILCGIYQRDAGTVIFDGQEVSFANPKQAMNDGIFIVHQELNLIPHLSVAQNIFIGKETAGNHKFFFSDKRLLNDSQKLFDSLKFKIDPSAKVSTLSVAEQQMVEVAKAVYNNVKILIMDEPTAPLTSSEIDQLFEIIRSLKAQGIAVIYISHRMEELSVIGDRITVMRDGKYIMTADLIQRTKILHFGTLSLTHNPAYTATRQAVACAKSNNVLVSFDPNYREALWKSCSEAKEQILWGLSVADIVKMSEDELNLATDCGHDINAGMQQILSLGPKEIYVTAGSKGAYFANVSQHGFTEAYCVNAIDTTGCGDAFMGAILYQKCYQPQKNIVERTIMANAAGAICATRPGGMCAMPTAQEVDMFINDNKC